ncbi:hypothetical protein RA272_28615, partial [Pseudomonas syringae pv. tagetis]|uniref:hypothetical protein n=1 Tax=Pseudomonas syringae group genomosp. 7 TaxID=251699 RepID=UPI00377065FD
MNFGPKTPAVGVEATPPIAAVVGGGLWWGWLCFACGVFCGLCWLVLRLGCGLRLGGVAWLSGGLHGAIGSTTGQGWR